MSLCRRPTEMCLVLVAGAFLCLVPAGCSDITVRSAYGPGMKYEGIGSAYDWAPGARKNSGDPWLDRPELHELLRRVIEAEMTAKKFHKSPAKAPDFWIRYAIAYQMETDRNASAHGVTYDRGFIILEVLDPSTKELIWQGAADARLDEALPPQQREERIKTAVRLLFERFPQQKRSPAEP
jgi:hypothetical protein